MKKILLVLFVLFLFGAGCQKDTQNSKNIVVDFPKPGDEVTFPFTIKGSARVLEDSVQIKIIEKGGKIIFKDSTTIETSRSKKFGSYEKEINYFLQEPTNNALVIEISSYSIKDGLSENKVLIPLNITLPDLEEAKVYFNNAKLDPKSLCTTVFPVSRFVPLTPIFNTTVLNVLLRGTSQQEHLSAFQTSINEGTKLNSLSVVDGTAYADFDKTLNRNVAGSCRVQAIRAQIEATLRQLPGIQSVVISVNGKSEGVLEP